MGADSTSLLTELYDLCRTNRIEIYHLDKEGLGRFTDLVNRIRGRERYIEATDTLIVAYSIADKECRGLLTFDRNLIDSKYLKDLIAKHVRDRKGYTITDQPTTS